MKKIPIKVAMTMAPPPPRRRRRLLGALLATASLVAVGAIAAYTPGEPPGCPPPPPSPRLGIELDSLAQARAGSNGVARVVVSGRVWVPQELRSGTTVRIGRLQVGVKWRELAGRCGVGESYEEGTFTTVLRLTPGPNLISAYVNAGGHGQVAHRNITVLEAARPRPRPVVVPVPRQRPSAMVAPRDVLLRGRVDSEAPVRVTVDGPSGRVQWDTVEPGPFASTVTIPDSGAHSVDVTVVDTWGRTTVTRFSISGYEVTQVSPLGDAPLLCGTR